MAKKKPTRAKAKKSPTRASARGLKATRKVAAKKAAKKKTAAKKAGGRGAAKKASAKKARKAKKTTRVAAKRASGRKAAKRVTAKRAAKKAGAKKAAARTAVARKAVARKVAARPLTQAVLPLPAKAPKPRVQRAPSPDKTRQTAVVPSRGAGSSRMRSREEEGEPHGVPSSLDVDRGASSARSGRREMRERLMTHGPASPAITAGDVDADWESAESVGDEAPGGDNPTPDQDVVDDIGRALGVEYDDDEELKGGDEITARDKHRWELDPGSSDDFEDR